MIKRFAQDIFRRFCHPDYYDEIVGDLEELYQRNLITGKGWAQWRYFLQVLTLFRPSLIRSFSWYPLIHPAMFRHYFRISTRVLLRHKFYTAVNILGLALGMGVCLVIYQYIRFELSYDRFHPQGQRTYRLTETTYRNGEDLGASIYTTYALGTRAKEMIPEVESFVRIRPLEEGLVVTNPDKNNPFQVDHMWYVDSTFLQIFDFPLKYGDRKSALDEPHSIVITEPLADRYFGHVNPVGKSLRVSGGTLTGDFIVTGVLEKLPINTHLQFDLLLPLKFMARNDGRLKNDEGWDRHDFVTYVTLNETANPAEVAGKLDQVIARYAGEELARSNLSLEIRLQPVADIHLRSDYRNELARNNGDIRNVRFFTIIAGFILLMAWVNFVNLSTARAMHRAKEVGVRKSIGALKQQLISQFMVESFLINGLAALLAVGVAYATLPLLNTIIGKELTLSILQSPMFWGWIAVVIMIGSLFSGFYPAWVLSSFKPLSVLKSVRTGQTGSFGLRRSLIVFQFLTSVLLISGTYLVYEQISFMKNQDLGMNIEKILVVNGPRVIINAGRPVLETKYPAFKHQAASHHSVAMATGSSHIPGKGYIWNGGIRRLGEAQGTEQSGSVVLGDADLSDVYGFEFLAGSRFSEKMSRWEATIINEEALRAFDLGTPEEALGEALIVGNNDTVGIQGVVKNVHWNSLKEAQPPLLFVLDNLYNVYFSFRINLSDIPETIAHIESAYHSVFPDDPFHYFFLDDDFNRQYQADLQFGKLFSAFSALAIFIACLGLFALVSYSATLRIKEIGIRKVLGASVSNLMMLLSKEYLILLLIAAVIAVPAVILGGRAWLDNYAYKTDMGIDLFLIPALILLLVSVLTVSYRTYAAARTNPAESLKTE